jgi:hypothetical protein
MKSIFCRLQIAGYLLLVCAAVSAAPPVVKTVPWVASNPLAPHDTWSGKAVLLKGTADVQGVPWEYTWDFGDGSPVVSGTVANMYAIEATHTYTGSVGQIFTARLTVRNTAVPADTASKEYYVAIRSQNLETEANVAIDDGLWYLHKVLVRYNDGAIPAGYWNHPNSANWRPAVTAANINAFEVNGHLEIGSSSNPYTETVKRAMHYLFSSLGALAVDSISTFGNNNPDSNGNGLGVMVWGSRSSSYDPYYQGGIIMDAIIASGTPNALAPGSVVNIAGRTYVDIVQDMVDEYAWAQSDFTDTRGGGWRYSPHEHPDNSACQWAAIGMIAAEREWGCTVPDWVKERNKVWLIYSQAANGVFGYTATSPIWGPYATTPSGMVQLTLDGIGRGTPFNPVGGVGAWDRSEEFIRLNFCNEGSASLAIKNYYYGLFSFVKSMLLHDSNDDQVAEPIDLLGGTFDWYSAESPGSTCDGVARTLVGDQIQTGGTRGLWTGHNYHSYHYPFENAWAIIMLNRTLFAAGAPVAVASANPNPAVAFQTINLDGSGSFHQDPTKSIVSYEWDLDNDGTYDVSGVNASVAFPAVGDYPVRLRVTDNGAPTQASATTILTIIVSTPPLAPTADAGGPYEFCPSAQPWFLDASNSSNPDEGQSEPGQPGDTIISYEWDLDGDSQFDDATGVSPDVTAFFFGQPPGNYLVQVRVTDNTASSYPSSGQPNLSSVDSATVTIYASDDPACACVEDLTARAKPGKIQLVWTHSGAPSYNIYRGTTAGGPYSYLDSTSSTYSTYLDGTVVNGTQYYYVLREVLPNGREICESNEATALPSARRR